MRSFAPPSWAAAPVVFAMSCTPAAETQSSSATNPSSWSSNDADAEARPGPKTTVPDKPTRWELVDRLSAFRKAAPRARSQHLGGEHDAEVLANEVATVYPTLGPLRALPSGSVLVEVLYAPNQAGVAAYFAMVKQASATGSSWEYLVVSSSGMVEQRGALPLCARCHAEAPYDHVFGRPR